MKRLLKSLPKNYRMHRDQILESAAKIAEALTGVESLKAGEEAVDEKVVKAIVEASAGMFDAKTAASAAPQVPHPSAIDLLLEVNLDVRQDWLLNIVTTTLEHMGKGGVYDQIGGAFIATRWTSAGSCRTSKDVLRQRRAIGELPARLPDYRQ